MVQRQRGPPTGRVLVELGSPHTGHHERLLEAEEGIPFHKSLALEDDQRCLWRPANVTAACTMLAFTLPALCMATAAKRDSLRTCLSACIAACLRVAHGCELDKEEVGARHAAPLALLRAHERRHAQHHSLQIHLLFSAQGRAGAMGNADRLPLWQLRTVWWPVVGTRACCDALRLPHLQVLLRCPCPEFEVFSTACVQHG
jgi:hypothetical protein